LIKRQDNRITRIDRIIKWKVSLRKRQDNRIKMINRLEYD